VIAPANRSNTERRPVNVNTELNFMNRAPGRCARRAEFARRKAAGACGGQHESWFTGREGDIAPNPRVEIQ
jgi:hypothetical protein